MASFFKKVGKFFKNYGAAILSTVFPIGGALLGAYQSGREAKKAQRSQERFQNEALAKQEALIKKQEEKSAQEEAKEQENIKLQRRSLLRRGRRQSLYGSPLGVQGEQQPLGQRTTLG